MQPEQTRINQNGREFLIFERKKPATNQRLVTLRTGFSMNDRDSQIYIFIEKKIYKYLIEKKQPVQLLFSGRISKFCLLYVDRAYG